MFWARPNGLKALFDLNLNWEDYPEEPLPYDGSLLHALERLFGVLVTNSGGSILLTNVPGITR
jgi:lipopolysaccharide biosynthesis protein